MNIHLLQLPQEGGASQVALEVKNLPASAEDVRDVGLIPGSRRSPGSNPGLLHCRQILYLLSQPVTIDP